MAAGVLGGEFDNELSARLLVEAELRDLEPEGQLHRSCIPNPAAHDRHSRFETELGGNGPDRLGPERSGLGSLDDIESLLGHTRGRVIGRCRSSDVRRLRIIWVSRRD